MAKIEKHSRINDFDYALERLQVERSRPHSVRLTADEAHALQTWRNDVYGLLCDYLDDLAQDALRISVVIQFDYSDIVSFLSNCLIPLAVPSLYTAFDGHLISHFEDEFWAKCPITAGFETKNWSFWRRCAAKQSEHSAAHQPTPRWELTVGSYQETYDTTSDYTIDEAWEGREIEPEKALKVGLILEGTVSPVPTERPFEVYDQVLTPKPKPPKPKVKRKRKPRNTGDRPALASRKPKQAKCTRVRKYFDPSVIDPK